MPPTTQHSFEHEDVHYILRTGTLRTSLEVWAGTAGSYIGTRTMLSLPHPVVQWLRETLESPPITQPEPSYPADDPNREANKARDFAQNYGGDLGAQYAERVMQERTPLTPEDEEMIRSLLPRNARTGEVKAISLVDDLADVLARMTVGVYLAPGMPELCEHPDVQRVLARYRKALTTKP